MIKHARNQVDQNDENDKQGARLACKMTRARSLSFPGSFSYSWAWARRMERSLPTKYYEFWLVYLFRVDVEYFKETYKYLGGAALIEGNNTMHTKCTMIKRNKVHL